MILYHNSHIYANLLTGRHLASSSWPQDSGEETSTQVHVHTQSHAQRTCQLLRSAALHHREYLQVPRSCVLIPLFTNGRSHVSSVLDKMYSSNICTVQCAPWVDGQTLIPEINFPKWTWEN
jgi:hypothetical protein